MDNTIEEFKDLFEIEPDLMCFPVPLVMLDENASVLDISACLDRGAIIEMVRYPSMETAPRIIHELLNRVLEIVGPYGYGVAPVIWPDETTCFVIAKREHKPLTNNNLIRMYNMARAAKIFLYNHSVYDQIDNSISGTIH